VQTLTFLNTDIEGSTLLLRRIGNEAYAEILAEHHRIIREQLAQFDGVEEGTAGDSFFAVFTSPSSAVLAASAMQEQLSVHAWPNGEVVKVRMGLHTGEASRNETGFVGYDVHRAARISSIGYGGQILLSSATAALVDNSLPSGVSLQSLGAHRLKDLGSPEQIFQLNIAALPQEFGTLRSLDNSDFPHNLPTSLNEFVGRRQDLLEINELVATSRLVTLTGAGGSGKTRLALQTAAEILDSSKDGVWFVELASITDADRIAGAIAATLSLMIDDESAAQTVLLRSLKDQHAVLVIDNCEHVVDAVADLLQLILAQCPNVKIIATSREPLGVRGEEVYRVRSLSLPPDVTQSLEELATSDSAQLFMTRGRSVARSFEVTDLNAGLVASIVRRLDGIPLAIELAAARLASMSIQDLHDRLDQRFRLLNGGSRSALPRHQTLGAMVSWSYDLLNDKERSVLRRLTVFVNGFELRAAESVCATDEIDEWDVADVLGALVNKSLVTAEHQEDGLRYRLLETIRQFGAEQLIATGGEAEIIEIRERHADFYLALAERLYPESISKNQSEALRQLDPERGNFLAAFLHFAAQPDGAECVIRLGVALSEFYRIRSIVDGWGTLSDALNALSESKTLLWANGAYNLISVATSIDHVGAIRSYPDAPALLTKAIDIARAEGDQSLATLICGLLSGRASSLHDEEQVQYWALRAFDEAKGCNDPHALGVAYGNYASTLEGEERKANYELSLKYYKESGNAMAIGRCLFFISNSLTDEEEEVPQRSVALLREAHRLASSIGAVSAASKSDSHLGLWLTASGEYEEAEVRTRRSTAVFAGFGLESGFFAWNALTMAEIARVAGNHERAVVLLGWSLEVLSDLTGSTWNEWEREFVANVERDGRAALGDASYQEIYQRGVNMDRNEAIAYLRQPTVVTA